MSPPARPLLDRFWEKVQTGEGCWQWTGSLARGGYGSIGFEGHTLRAHRVAYEALVGPIPEGLVLDHLCRNRGCVNPTHLEPVTLHENLLRGEPANRTHCPAGHAYTAQNTWMWHGKRKCRECGRLRQRRAYYRQKAAAA